MGSAVVDLSGSLVVEEIPVETGWTGVVWEVVSRLVVVCAQSTVTYAEVSVIFSVVETPGDQDVLEVYAVGDGVSLAVVSFLVAVTSGGRVEAVKRVLRGESAVGVTTVVVFLVVAVCSEVGDAGTADVVVLVGDVSGVQEDGSGMAVVDVRGSVGDVRTVCSVGTVELTG